MDKRFVYTDIGDFGSNDCVVRAFMQALGMSFAELCKDFHLKSKDGKLKDGFEGLTWMDVPRKYLCRSIALYKWSNWDDNLTVDEFCDITKELYPGVDFVLGCTGRIRGKRVDHATFVRDGRFHDLHEEVGRWRCYSFFAFRNGKSIHLKEDPDPTFDESGKYIHNIHLENNNMKKINENTKVTLTLSQIKRLVKETRKVKESEEDGVIPFEDLEVGDIICRDGYPNVLSAVIKKGPASEIDDALGSIEDGIKDGTIQPDTPCVLAQDLDDKARIAWVYGDGGVIALRGMGNVNNYTGVDRV